MTMSVASLRDDLRAKYGTPRAPEVPAHVPEDPSPERAFVVTGESGRTAITAPLREIATTNDGFLYLRGRMVGSEQPNSNGAFWTNGDLQFGESTVAGGPVNWLHDETHIVGALLDGEYTREAASSTPHIVSTMTVWRFLYPREAEIIERAAAEGTLMQSMECVAREVACMDSPDGTRSGCGATFGYREYQQGKACQHLRERSSMRRFIDPVFLGTAIIVPPVRPADSAASLELMGTRAAAERAEDANPTLTASQAHDLAGAVMGWVNRDAPST